MTREERILAIKKRLNAERESRGMTVNAVAGILENSEWFVTRYSAKTAFAECSPSLDGAALLAICEEWGLDVAEVTRDPSAPRDSFERPSGSAFVDLADPKYDGKYVAYCSPRKEGREGELWKGEFEIKIDAAAATNSTKLTVEESPAADGAAPIVKRYSGKSTFSIADRAIVSILSNEMGGMVVVWFRYEPYVHTDGMYFRVANVMTCELPSRTPIVQRMALFDHDVEDENLDYVRGLLKVGDGTVTIGRAAMVALRKSDPEVEELWKRHGAAMERETEETLAFTFGSLDGARRKASAADAMAFLKVMAASYAPSECSEWTPTPVADATRGI